MRDGAVAVASDHRHQGGSHRERDATNPRPRPRPDEETAAHAQRLGDAVNALERVRTQLDRTQRTLDAFVTQITGIPTGAAPVAGRPRTVGPPPAGAGPASSREPDATPPAPSGGGANPDAARPGKVGVPPGLIADHVIPGRHPLPVPADEASVEPDRPVPPRRTADDPTPRWSSRVRAIGAGPLDGAGRRYAGPPSPGRAPVEGVGPASDSAGAPGPPAADRSDADARAAD